MDTENKGFNQFKTEQNKKCETISKSFENDGNKSRVYCLSLKLNENKVANKT